VNENRKRRGSETARRALSQKKNTTPARTPYILAGLAVIIIIALVGAYPYIIPSTGSEAEIRIPANASQISVKDTLSKYYGEKFASRVIRLASMRRTDWSKRHGRYVVGNGSNALAVARRISGGAQTPVKITINGFRDLDEMTERMSRKFEFPADSLRALISDPEFLSPYDLTPDQAMALFIDDTYELYWTATPRDVLKKIGENYRRVWDDTRKNKASALGLKPAEVMIIASITDEETNADSEKGTIGRLYINRYKKGMRLQADHTVRFSIGKKKKKRVKGEHLRTDSPYNTYRYAGLPPGPIRTTGTSTIDRILDSEPNNYLYMCAKEDFSGTHNFAATYEKHMANAKKYQNALDKKGIN